MFNSPYTLTCGPELDPIWSSSPLVPPSMVHLAQRTTWHYDADDMTPDNATGWRAAIHGAWMTDVAMIGFNVYVDRDGEPLGYAVYVPGLDGLARNDGEKAPMLERPLRLLSGPARLLYSSQEGMEARLVCAMRHALCRLPDFLGMHLAWLLGAPVNVPTGLLPMEQE